VKIDLNGAARYSDYSTSGGIWSWKAGGTVRLFNDLLLRVTRSRDIRSANLSELYTSRTVGIGPVSDPLASRYVGTPGYNSTPTQVTTFGGGNPSLSPETAKTFTVGASYSPSFFRGFSVSVDYYNINIANAITLPSSALITQACAAGNAAGCAAIVRDSTNTITTVFSTYSNLAALQIKGVDFDAAYITPLSRISANLPGTLRLRLLATYVSHFVYNTGVTSTDVAGDVGSLTFSVPHWKATFSAAYQGEAVGFDMRVRFAGGGKYDHTQDLATTATGNLTGIVNNSIAGRTYLDLGAQFRIAKKFELFVNVNNVTDTKPPVLVTTSPFYDVIGRYYTAGARVRF
jgi:iron complex outermembrane receptor protein